MVERTLRCLRMADLATLSFADGDSFFPTDQSAHCTPLAFQGIDLENAIVSLIDCREPAVCLTQSASYAP
jgi:hypothetical protein